MLMPRYVFMHSYDKHRQATHFNGKNVVFKKDKTKFLFSEFYYTEGMLNWARGI